MDAQEVLNKVMATISKSDIEKNIRTYESMLKSDLMSGDNSNAQRLAVKIAAMYKTLNELN